MIHIVKGFGIINKAEIDVFLEVSCFFDDPADVGKAYILHVERPRGPLFCLPKGQKDLHVMMAHCPSMGYINRCTVYLWY